MGVDVRCKNENCPYGVVDMSSSMWPRKCASPPGGKAIITETGECETYWYAVAAGKATDIREIPLSENPHLEPMYKRLEGRTIPVVAAVIHEAGKVLLARRVSRHAEEDGRWEFPGGAVEVGESPEEALVREVREELGIEVRPTRIIHTSINRYTFVTSVVLFYICIPPMPLDQLTCCLDESCVSEVRVVELNGVSELNPLKGAVEAVTKLKALRGVVFTP